MKELKNYLKKESCYTALFPTARIRGVEKLTVTFCDQPDRPAQEIPITEKDMTFGLLIAKTGVFDPDQNLLMAFQNYELVDDKKSKLISSAHYTCTCTQHLHVNLHCSTSLPCYMPYF